VSTIQLPQKKTFMAIVGVLLGVLLFSLDSTIVGIAMPKIVKDLLGFELYSWPFTAYLLCSTAATVIFGKLADMFGRKLIFIIGLIIFIIASMLCGISSGMLMFILFRGLQGLGGGILISNAFAIAGELFELRKRGMIMGVVASMFGIGSILGPIIGGTITEHFGWHWIFYINIPIGILSIIILAIYLPGKLEERSKQKIDIAGILTFLIFLIPLLLALSMNGNNVSLSDPLIIVLFCSSIIGLIAFILIELKVSQPILPPKLFKSQVFNLSMAGTFLTNTAFYAAIVFLPLYLQEVQKWSASISGFLLTPMMLAFACASIFTGQVTVRLGRSKPILITGYLLIIAGCIMISFFSTNTSIFYSIIAMAILGLGLGTTTPMYNMNVQAVFPRNMMSVLTGMVQFFRNVGGIIGIAIYSTILGQYLQMGIGNINWGHVPENVRSIFSSKVLMNSTALEAIKAKVPEAYQTYMQDIYKQLEHLLSSGIAFIFLIAIFISLLALLTGIFQKECFFGKDAIRNENFGKDAIRNDNVK